MLFKIGLEKTYNNNNLLKNRKDNQVKYILSYQYPYQVKIMIILNIKLEPTKSKRNLFYSSE